MSNVIPFNETEKMSQIISRSDLLPVHLRKKPSDVLVLLQMGIELGLKPMQAINGIHVIQGKPTVSPQLMLALIYNKFPNALIDIREEGENYICEMARTKDAKPYKSVWDMKRANEMGLTGKDNWKKQAKTMLKWRAVSDAARVVFPDAIQGFYTVEELDSNGNVEYDDGGELKQPPKQVQNEAENPAITKYIFGKHEGKPEHLIMIENEIIKITNEKITKEARKEFWGTIGAPNSYVEHELKRSYRIMCELLGIEETLK